MKIIGFLLLDWEVDFGTFNLSSSNQFPINSNLNIWLSSFLADMLCLSPGPLLFISYSATYG